MAELKVIIEAAKILKKYWPYIAAILLLIVLVPIIIINILTSWMGIAGGDEEDAEYLALAGQYRQLAVEHGLQWQQILAIDLALHEMDQDKLDPSAIVKEFYYFEIKYIPVYETKKVNGVVIVTDKIIRYDEEKTKRVRTFYQVMDRLNLNQEQREMADMVIDGIMDSQMDSGGLGVSGSVMAFEPLVRKYAIIYQIENHVGLLLALIQQESGGRVLDVMQSSESAGLPPNTFTNPEDSIAQGVKYFASVLIKAKGDQNLALQSYNFGIGFINYALPLGGYSKANAISFSKKMAEQYGWSRYGDVNYVDNVLRYMNQFITGDTDQKFDVNEVYQIMRNYIGMQYVWGGRNPSAGGFDCSGLLEYSFGLIGVNISGTAESQYNKTVAVSENSAKPGDLVFFKTTEKEISHVGMYIGNGKFINANNNGVEESSMDIWRGLYSFKGFRRIQ